MFKIHLLATERGQGKTSWLRENAVKIMYSSRFLQEPENILLIVPVLKYIEHDMKMLKKEYPRLMTCNFDQIDRAFRGFHIHSVFIDEYQKLSAQQWHDLKTHMPLGRVEELYLAGDNYFTIDQLSRNPNDSEHLYRRLADQENEINRLKQRG